MRARIEVLNDLISLKSNLRSVQKELLQYSWDVDESIVLLRRADLRCVIQKYLNDNLSADDLEDWANAIECREDISFENENIKECILILANPLLNGKIDKDVAIKLIASIDTD